MHLPCDLWRGVLVWSALVFATGVFAQTPPSAEWPVAVEGLTPDPTVRWSRLPNGLRVAVYTHPEPKNRVSLRLLVLAGSLHETPEQRGLAHFVEHMAFNGTRRFPRETLARVLQRHGQAFGADLNAFTYATHTIYQLEIPIDRDGLLEENMTVLRDFAGGITFDPREVDRERGVVLSEKRQRDTPGARSGAARQYALYPDSPLGRNLPIGDLPVLTKAGPADLRRYYEMWYRPERMVVVAVGDAPAEQLEQLVTRHFADLASPPLPAPAEPDLGQLGNPPEVRPTLHTNGNGGGGGVGVELVSITRVDDRRDTPDGRLHTMARHLAMTMLHIRLKRIQEREGTRLGTGLATLNQPIDGLFEATVRIDSFPRDWRYALATAEQELRRALLHGFTASEIAEATAIIESQFATAARTFNSITSANLAGSIVATVLNENVYTHPHDNLQIVRQAFARLTPADYHEALRTLWTPGQPRVFIGGNLNLQRPEPEILEAWRASAAVAVTAPIEAGVSEWRYTRFGPPGEIRTRRHAAAVDVHTVEFENGVRLNLKRTDFETQTVRFAAHLGFGNRSEPDGQRGLGMLAGRVFTGGGLRLHDRQEIARLLAGKSLAFNFDSGENAFEFSGHSDSANLLLLLQLITAWLTDPGWRPGQLDVAKEQLRSEYNRIAFDPRRLIGTYGRRVLAGGDRRYGLAKSEEMQARTLEELRAWLDPVLNEGPLELGLVGDFDIEQTILWAAQTIGTLPRRAAADTAAFPPVAFAKKPSRHRFVTAGSAEESTVQLHWPLDHCDDISRMRRLEVLTQILENRARDVLREEMGATYSPEAWTWSSEIERSRGGLVLGASSKPRDTKKLVAAMRKLADNLARTGPATDEFERARQPLVARVAADLRNNNYWLRRVVLLAQSQPQRLANPLTREPELRAMTTADLVALAREVLPEKRAIQMTAEPR